MAYADQEVSGNKIAAFVVVALLHLALGYALVTGLAYEGFKQVVKKVTTVDIKKDEPKKEPPPPPKKMAAAPPIVVPPPMVKDLSSAPPPQDFTTSPQPPPRARRLRRRRRRSPSSPRRAHSPRVTPATGRQPTTIRRAPCVKNAKASPGSA